jgi:hypothetical protein
MRYVVGVVVVRKGPAMHVSNEPVMRLSVDESWFIYALRRSVVQKI